jgi:hypothetical protein
MRGQDYAKSAMNPQDKALGSYTEAVFSCYIELKIYAVRSWSPYFFIKVISVEITEGLRSNVLQSNFLAAFPSIFEANSSMFARIQRRVLLLKFKTRIIMMKMY